MSEPNEATYCGERPDQGRIVVGQQFPGEGYAVIRCGNTEVQVGYSVLRNARLDLHDTIFFADLSALRKALYAITCEASLGRTGDGAAVPEPEEPEEER